MRLSSSGVKGSLREISTVASSTAFTPGDDAEEERVAGAFRVEHSLEREDDVVDRHRAAVVELHALLIANV